MGNEIDPNPIAARINLLSPRHRDCLRLAYHRRRTKEIAAELGLAPGTVSTYCTEAIRLLGARDRRDAAERLHAWEAGLASSPPPSRVEPPSEGVAVPARPEETANPPPPSRRWRLPLRDKDASGNDLAILDRLFWIPILAVLALVGFGAAANGLHVLSDLVRSLGGR